MEFSLTQAALDKLKPKAVLLSIERHTIQNVTLQRALRGYSLSLSLSLLKRVAGVRS